jgi:hypothetical protein
MLKALRGDTWKNVEMPIELKVRFNDRSLSKYFKGSLAGSGLTVDEITQIRNKYANGSSIRELALEFFTSRNSVTNIVYGKSFKNVPGPVAKKVYCKKCNGKSSFIISETFINPSFSGVKA